MRRKKTFKTEIEPDPIYNDVRLARFINNVMKGGKKSVAERVVYGALEIVKSKTKTENPLEIFNKAMDNASPLVEVKSRRVGGANYQVPYEVRGKRKEALAMRWIIGAARSKKGKPMAEKLAQEFIDASNNQGEAMRKRENMHRMAEANKAFAHFAW
jgi:small subunit ribosomal protein S7